MLIQNIDVQFNECTLFTTKINTLFMYLLVSYLNIKLVVLLNFTHTLYQVPNNTIINSLQDT